VYSLLFLLVSPPVHFALAVCMKTLGRGLAVALLCHGVIAGPPGLPSERTPTVRSAPRKLHGRFLHITGVLLCPSSPNLSRPGSIN
jgi:hypothetical protein